MSDTNLNHTYPNLTPLQDNYKTAIENALQKPDTLEIQVDQWLHNCWLWVGIVGVIIWLFLWINTPPFVKKKNKNGDLEYSFKRIFIITCIIMLFTYLAFQPFVWEYLGIDQWFSAK